MLGKSSEIAMSYDAGPYGETYTIWQSVVLIYY